MNYKLTAALVADGLYQIPSFRILGVTVPNTTALLTDGIWVPCIDGETPAPIYSSHCPSGCFHRAIVNYFHRQGINPPLVVNLAD